MYRKYRYALLSWLAGGLLSNSVSLFAAAPPAPPSTPIPIPCGEGCIDGGTAGNPSSGPQFDPVRIRPWGLTGAAMRLLAEAYPLIEADIRENGPDLFKSFPKKDAQSPYLHELYDIRYYDISVREVSDALMLNIHPSHRRSHWNGMHQSIDDLRYEVVKKTGIVYYPYEQCQPDSSFLARNPGPVVRPKRLRAVSNARQEPMKNTMIRCPP